MKGEVTHFKIDTIIIIVINRLMVMMVLLMSKLVSLALLLREALVVVEHLSTGKGVKQVQAKNTFTGLVIIILYFIDGVGC